MILKMLQQIGYQHLGELDRLTNLIRSQPEYKEKNILLVDIDINDKTLASVKVLHEEYDDNKEISYLRGTQSGNAPSLSPSMNFNMTNILKHDFKKDNDFQKLVLPNVNQYFGWEKYFQTSTGQTFLKDVVLKDIKIINKFNPALNKQALQKQTEDEIPKKTYIYLIQNSEKLTYRIVHYLLTTFCNFKSDDLTFLKTPKVSMPKTIIFRIIINNFAYFPGDLDEFKDLYLSFVDDGVKNVETPLSCITCNKQHQEINRPTIGIFTLDMLGFSQGFIDQAKSPQFSVCDDCHENIKQGYGFLDDNLNFYAYKTKKGEFGSQNINHYIIPIVFNKVQLSKALNAFNQAKINLGEYSKKSLRKRINALNNAATKADRTRKNTLNKWKRDLEKELNKSAEALAEKADLIDLVNGLLDQNLTYLDIYYFVTDAKQNPKTKEIIGAYQISDTSIRVIQKAINQLNREYQVTVNFYRMIKLLPIKEFLNIQAALFLQKPISDETFVKEVGKSILQSFKYHLFNLDLRNDKIPMVRFDLAIRYFKHMYLFLALSNVFSTEVNYMTQTTKSKNQDKSESEKTEKRKISTQERVDYLKKELTHPFFNSADLKATAAIGLYFRMVSYAQDKELGTKTLVKDTRVWFKEFNKKNILQIFAECNRINFIASEKLKRSNPMYASIRLLIEEYLKEDTWESSPEQLSLAFMIGYDSFSSIYGIDPMEDEEEEGEDNNE
jgi:hypothetical protein